ncbi:MAG: recombinase family protein [Proteobacteria bacterium]|nr:recombinase family protein [Pseudomonadota bacterium]
MSETERFERYVAYYRMPDIGDTQHGDTLARQRGLMTAFLDHPARGLVGEFTEVMTPAYQGETSPAFDLSLDCCRDLGAKLICAVSDADLAPAELEKAAHNHIEILMIGGVDSPPSSQPDIQPAEEETAPYLRFGRRRHTMAPPRPRRPDGAAKAGNLAKADRFAEAILPIIDQIRESGATTLTDIAKALNARNIRTARGRRWHPTTVKNVLNRRP